MANGLGLQGAYGADAVSQELVRLVEERAKAELAKQAEAHRQAQLALASRGMDIDERQGDARIGLEGQRVGLEGQRVGLEKDKFGFEQAQWGEMAPQRAANLDQTAAETWNIRRQPDREAADRTHDGTMLDKRGAWNLREIGAQGAEQRKTQTHGASFRAPQPGSGQSPYAQERNLRNKQSIEQLLQKANGWNTGLGSALANLPATDARNFAAELNTLKANIAFGELAAMREASKTGGALGAVSERELALLESALGALDPGQSTENFKQQLQKIHESIGRWESASGQANAPSVNFGGGRTGGAGSAQGGASKFKILSVK